MQRKRLTLKKTYYLIFSFLIVLPLILVLVVSLAVLSRKYKNQAVENIERAQETVVAEFLSDVDFMSIRLSQLINTNDNEILNYAAGTDTADSITRYEYQRKLQNAGNLMLEPVKDIVSVAFYMKDGKTTYIKNDIKRTRKETEACEWYKQALDAPNSVRVGAYQTRDINDLYTGGKKDAFILNFGISPDRLLDRSGLVEMVAFYQATDVGNTIREFNTGYKKGENRLGVMQVADSGGNVIFATEKAPGKNKKGYTCVRTPIRFNGMEWYVESYIRTRELTSEFNRVGIYILLIAVLVFALAGYFAEYFIKTMVKPIEEISTGLKQVEDGNLDIHITPAGQVEIRAVIHRFNAMCRSLKALIETYEERVRGAGKSPRDYFAAMVRNEMKPEQVDRSCAEFFQDSYAVIGMKFSVDSDGRMDAGRVAKMMEGFEMNPRFTARCICVIENPVNGYVFYRITEENYLPRIQSLFGELQAYARREHGIEMDVFIGKKCHGAQMFDSALQEVRESTKLRFLYGGGALVDLSRNPEGWRKLLQQSEDYGRFAEYIYTGDEKNYVQEKERLFEELNKNNREEAVEILCAVILAVARRFDADSIRLSDIFNQKVNYIEKIERLEDVRSIRMWLLNWLAWMLEYSKSKLDTVEDVMVKAKRYLADHYEDADLTLASVADYVGLNEKYFSNRFTKETGETFSSYLTQLRVQKARELLRTTTFKVYEISEMVGYRNPEHFNRMFKKVCGISPAQFRKQNNQK